MTPINLSNPSANKARTTQPTHIEIMEAFLLCLRIAASIISCTSSFVICVMDFSDTYNGKHYQSEAQDSQTDGII